MTSGTMVLQIDASGEGTAQFVNLDNFGEAAVTLHRVEARGKRISFSASGEGPGEFAARARLSGSGDKLEGKGEYEGFPIKFKLERR
jgi:hypothetical protein